MCKRELSLFAGKIYYTFAITEYPVIETDLSNSRELRERVERKMFVRKSLNTNADHEVHTAENSTLEYEILLTYGAFGLSIRQEDGRWREREREWSLFNKQTPV